VICADIVHCLSSC